MSRNFLFSSNHYTKLHQVTKILKHTLCWKFKSCYKVNQKKKQVLLFFSMPHHTERKPRSGEKSRAHACVQRRANPLLTNLSKSTLLVAAGEATSCVLDRKHDFHFFLLSGKTEKMMFSAARLKTAMYDAFSVFVFPFINRKATIHNLFIYQQNRRNTQQTKCHR